MPKNIHTYCAKLDALWNQMSSTVDYLVRCKGIEWVESNSCGAIRAKDGIDDPDDPWYWHFNGSADDCAAVVDDLVLKMQREAHGDPNYTI